jgi:competence protein ComEC
MHPYGEVPFVRLAVAFAAGILLYTLWRVQFPFFLVPSLVGITLAMQAWFGRSSRMLFRNIHWLGVGLNASLVAVGNFLSYQLTDFNQPRHFIHSETDYPLAIFKLTEPPVEKEKSVKVNVRLLYLADSNKVVSTKGKSIIYLEKDSASLGLNYGEVILSRNNFQAVPPPKNPGEFDYRRYLWYQEVYATAYLKKGDWQRTSQENKAQPVRKFSYWMRDQCRAAFKKYITREREEAVMEALVIGYRDHMSPEVQDAYSSAGVIHVLAVSGLHVGILYWVIERMLMFMKRKRQWVRARSLLIIVVIWLFALVTGLSGSVVRAATMFSLISLGKNWSKTANPFNVIASSALLILAWNPLLIMDVGFQLSYAAVISISAFSPYMNWWFTRQTRVGDFIWRTTSMSVAAQIGTLPLTSFYFHQFPSLFLFANLVVIPVSSVLLIGGLILALFQWFTPFATALGFLLEWIEWGMNEFILFMSRIDFAVLRLGTVTWWQAAVLLLVIIFITQYFIRKEKPYWFLFLSGILLLVASGSVMHWVKQGQKTVTLYAFRKNSVVEFRNGSGAVLISDSAFLSDPWQVKYFSQHNQQRSIDQWVRDYWGEGALQPGSQLKNSLYRNQDFFQMENFRLVRINHSLPKVQVSSRLPVDAVLISGNPKVTIAQVLQYYFAPQIIVDGSNYPSRVKKWKEEALHFPVTVYDLMTDGAWVQTIK